MNDFASCRNILAQDLSCSNVLVQCLSYGTLAGEEFLHHALNLLAEASLVEIESCLLYTSRCV